MSTTGFSPKVLGILLVLSACRAEPEPAPLLSWARLDLSREPFAVEAGEPVIPKISFLGSAEVRDMRLVPASQLVSFPRRTAGQIQALEMKAGSRARWPVRVGRDSYFSFTPLGSEGACPCTYRVGVRSGSGPARELYRIESAPMGPIAPTVV